MFNKLRLAAAAFTAIALFAAAGPAQAVLTLDATHVSSASDLVVDAGASGALTLGASVVGGSLVTGGSLVAGTYTLGGAAQVGTITIGRSTAGQTINIGQATVATGNSQAINIGTAAAGTGVDVVTIGNLNGASSVALQAGTAGITLTGVATGLKVTGAAAASGVALTAVSTGTNENMTIDAKGSGTITVNGTATGAITLGRATTITTGGLAVTAGGILITAGGLNVNSTGITLAGAVSGVTTIAASGQITSTLADGTAPFVVTSNKPVANLTTVPATYNAAGTQLANAHIVTGRVSLASASPSTATVTLTAPAAFTSNVSYQCTVSDATTQPPSLGFKVTYTDGANFVISGPNTVTDSVAYICVGN